MPSAIFLWIIFSVICWVELLTSIEFYALLLYQTHFYLEWNNIDVLETNIRYPSASFYMQLSVFHGPTRYAKLRVAHAPGMPGTFSPPPLVSDPDMHHGTCLTHVPWCMSGSLTSGFLWNRWRRKRSRHSRRMRNPQFCVSGKRPMGLRFKSINSVSTIGHTCIFITPSINTGN